jgi:tRNA (adenine37-N6)-methyltransferase
MLLEPIGVLRTCYGGKFGTPRQPGLCPSAWGSLVFHEPYRSREALRGIEGFSHVWLIFAFHETIAQGWKPTVRPPRLGGNRRMGVFASRSPFRPNGLGLSLVRLEGIRESKDDGAVLLLGGVDLVDGTPVHDIKPYLPYAECIPDASAGFATEEIVRLKIEIADEAVPRFESLTARAQAVIRESLALDPRPAVCEEDPGRVYGAMLCGHDVRFSVRGDTCWVVEIL